jgi:hypothetical protein
MKRVLTAAMLLFSVITVHADDEGSDIGGTDSFNGVYFALGVGAGSVESKAKEETGGNTRDYGKQTVNKVSGVAVFGAGKKITDAFYTGGELLIDYGKSKSEDVKFDGQKVGSVRSRGVTPSLAFRPGFVYNTDNLIYAKLGLSFPSTIIRDEDNREITTVKKPSYIVGIGFERNFTKKFSGRLEGEYVSSFKKDGKIGGSLFKAECNGGFNFRVLAVYNVKY